MSSLPAVTITGVGVVSPVGTGDGFAAAWQAAASGIGDSARLAADGQPVPAADVGEIDVNSYLEAKKTYLDRCSAFALVAASLALRDAGLANGDAGGERDGICLGSAFGCVETMQAFLAKVYEKGAKFANSLLFSHSYVNTPTSLVAIEYGLRGFHTTVSSGFTSGLVSLQQACDAVSLGRADRVLAGGVDALEPTLYRALAAASLLAGADTSASAADGNGLVLGEGAGVFVLELLDAARRRGAVPHALIGGYGLAHRGAETSFAPAIRRADAAAWRMAERQPTVRSLLYTAVNGGHDADSASPSDVDEQELLAAWPGAVEHPKARLGEAMSATGPLALAGACVALAGADAPDAVLVRSVDPGGGVASLIVVPSEGGLLRSPN